MALEPGDQIGLSNHSDQLLAIEHRQTMQPLLAQQRNQRHRWLSAAHSDHRSAHDLFNPHVLPVQQPPPTEAPLRHRRPGQVAEGDNSHHLLVLIQYRQRLQMMT
ncbi:hypothetical protein D3C85_1487090 [compost metagenome]